MIDVTVIEIQLSQQRMSRKLPRSLIISCIRKSFNDEVLPLRIIEPFFSTRKLIKLPDVHLLLKCYFFFHPLQTEQEALIDRIFVIGMHSEWMMLSFTGT